MIREAILTIKPCIRFDNTGSETQMYSRLIKKIQDIDNQQQKHNEKEEEEEKRQKSNVIS
jgi:CRISPR/Cas system CSM-associated protein Csm4 (group 5 of RAMP superfamily)